MQFFVMFIVGAVVLGAGAMLSPAWVTREPRIGLAAALALALVVGGAVFWAEAFGWDTLVIDYLLFALMSGVILGGTLSQAQARAEARGETLSDEDQGWPGPRDLAFFALVGVLAALPLLVLPVPYGDAGQSSGYLALTALRGGGFDTLAPYHPEVQVLQAPGFPALTAYLTQQLKQSFALVQFAVGAVVAFLIVWLVYDLGAELRDKRLGRALSLALLIGGPIVGMLLNGHYGALLGALFALAALLYLIRVQRHGLLPDIVGAGLLIGATLFASVSLFLVLLGTYLLWLLTMHLPFARNAEEEPLNRTRVLKLLAVPLVTLAGTAPWLLGNADLISSTSFASQNGPRLEHVLLFITAYGGLLPALALLGAGLALSGVYSGLRQAAVLALGALLIALDLSSVGLLAALIPGLSRFVHAESVALFGPLLPYTILGGVALLWLWEKLPSAIRVPLRQQAPIIFGVASLAAILGGAALLLSDSFTSSLAAADQRALYWLRSNSADDARLLNHPEQGGWAAAITGRDAVYVPVLDNFQPGAALREEQASLRAFWQNPADAAHAELLRSAGVTHVVVPKDAPEAEAVAAAAYLEPVYSDDGAAIYELREAQS